MSAAPPQISRARAGTMPSLPKAPTRPSSPTGEEAKVLRLAKEKLLLLQKELEELEAKKR